MAETKSIMTPIPGVFYRRPSPEQDVYVKEGQHVKAGDTLCLIEVMKNFYEIKAEFDGILERFVVENEALVDAGQEIAIMRIE